MMKIHNEYLYTQITRALQEAVNELSVNYSGSSLTDLFIVVDKDAGEVAIYDDEKNCVTEAIVDQWAEASYEDLSDKYIASTLKDVLNKLNEGDDIFSALELYKPFSVSYSDLEFNIIEELLTITEDSTISLNDDLLEKLDKDFEEFLKRLMEE